MIRILKEGDKLFEKEDRYLIKCEKCGCEFAFDKNDVYEMYDCEEHYYKYFIRCPWCDYQHEKKSSDLYTMENEYKYYDKDR